jgi:hypothetical protein
VSIGWMPAGPSNIVRIGVAGHLGTGQLKKKPASGRACLVVACADGKKIFCAAVMRQTPCSAGDMAVWIHKWSRYALRPFSLEMRTNSTI